MAATRTPIKTNPHQGEFLSGIQVDPHFTDAPPEPDVAYGVSVDLQERNEALQEALLTLGRLARAASFQNIGRRQHEGSRSPAVREIEGRMSQAQMEEKLTQSRLQTKPRKDKLSTDFDTAFGVEKLSNGAEQLEIHTREGDRKPLTEADIEEAAKWGGPVAPLHKQGKKEFEERFGGSNNKVGRDRYKASLSRQATQLRRIHRQQYQRN